MFNRNQVILLTITLATLTLSGYLFWAGLTQGQPPSLTTVSLRDQPAISPSPDVLGGLYQTAKVLEVVDGDTITVRIGEQVKKLRYIGVDSPETVDPRRPVGCFGKEASKENKRLVDGKLVELEQDVSETDKFGRLLRYVYLRLDDGNKLFLNDYLIRQGFGLSSTFPPDVKYADRFKEAQREAQENRRGLWDKCQ